MFNVSVRKIVVSAVAIAAPVALSLGAASTEAWGKSTTGWSKTGPSTHSNATTGWSKSHSTTITAGKTVGWSSKSTTGWS